MSYYLHVCGKPKAVAAALDRHLAKQPPDDPCKIQWLAVLPHYRGLVETMVLNPDQFLVVNVQGTATWQNGTVIYATHDVSIRVEHGWIEPPPVAPTSGGGQT